VSAIFILSELIDRQTADPENILDSKSADPKNIFEKKN